MTQGRNNKQDKEIYVRMENLMSLWENYLDVHSVNNQKIIFGGWVLMYAF